MSVWGVVSIVSIGTLLCICFMALSSALLTAKILRDIFLYKLFDIEESSAMSSDSLTYKKVVKRFIPIIGSFTYNNVQYELPTNSQVLLQVLFIILLWTINLAVSTDLPELNIGAAIGVACCTSCICMVFTHILTTIYLSTYNLKEGTPIYQKSVREVHASDSMHDNQTSIHRRAFKTARVGESTFLEDKLNASYLDKQYCLSHKSRSLEGLLLVVGAACGLAGMWMIFKGAYEDEIVLETAFYANCIGIAVDFGVRVVVCYPVAKFGLSTNYEKVYKSVSFVVHPKALNLYKKTPCIQSQALIIDHYADNLNLVEQPFYREDLADSRQEIQNTPIDISYEINCAPSPAKFFKGEDCIDIPKHDNTEPDYENPGIHQIQPAIDEPSYSFIETGLVNPEETAESYQEYMHQDVSFNEFLLSPQKRLVDSPSPQKSLVFESSPSPARFYLFEDLDDWHLQLKPFDDDEPEPLGEQDTIGKIDSSTVSEQEPEFKGAFQRKIEFTEEELNVKFFEISKKSEQEYLRIEDVLESSITNNSSQIREVSYNPQDFITPNQSRNISLEIGATFIEEEHYHTEIFDMQQLFENPIRVTDFTDFEEESVHSIESLKDNEDMKNICYDMKSLKPVIYESPPYVPREPLANPNISFEVISDNQLLMEAHSIKNIQNSLQETQQHEDIKVISMPQISETQESNEKSKKIKKKKRAKTKPPTQKTAHYLKQHTIDIYCSDPKLTDALAQPRSRSHSNSRRRSSKESNEIPSSRSHSVERTKGPSSCSNSLERVKGPSSRSNSLERVKGPSSRSNSAERAKPSKLKIEALSDRNRNFDESGSILLERASKSAERYRMQANFHENTKQIDSAELAELLDENSDSKHISIDAKVFKKRSNKALLKDAEELMKVSKSSPHGEDPQIQKLIQILASRQSFRKKYGPSKSRRILPYSEAAILHDETVDTEKIVYLDHEFNLKQKQKLESVSNIYSTGKLQSPRRKSSREGGSSRGRMRSNSPKEYKVSNKDL